MFFFFFEQKNDAPSPGKASSDKARKLKERAPKQISSMVARIKKIRSQVDDETIQYQLKELALACEVEIKPVEKSFHYSQDMRYRYYISRIWDKSKPYALFICLNSSVTEAMVDDKTTTRCIKYAKSSQYGGVYIANLFAITAPTPREMMKSDNPIGDENDMWLAKLAKNAGITIAAWGNKGNYLNRSAQVRNLLPNLHYLKLNNSGEPAQPLFLDANLKLDSTKNRLEVIKKI